MASEYKSLTSFLLEAPLYEEFVFSENLKGLYELYGSSTDSPEYNSNSCKIDGYCSGCGKDATFTLSPHSVPRGDPWQNLAKRYSFDNLQLKCVRDEKHRIWFYIRKCGPNVMKIGQFPSLADVAINELRTKYKAVLKGDNWSELCKAVGLAAHGEGIGSFVYLRRVFERLVFQRFKDHENEEGWVEKDFISLRMSEKVTSLSKHLPAFLVENAKLYSIFSRGIHELDNDQCLAFFEAGKGSILFILEDDLKHKEEAAKKKLLSDAVRTFEALPNTTPEEVVR
jgi:hypothetical protein